MRIKANIELNKAELPLDYRRLFLSLLKHGLSKLDDNGEILERYFSSTVQKPYAFALFIPNGKFSDKVYFDKPNVKLLFTTDNYQCFGDFYNALNILRKKWIGINNVQMRITSINLQTEDTITESCATIKLLSPLVLREHSRDTNHDRYYTVEDEEFEEKLRAIVASQLTALKQAPELADQLHVVNVKSARKTVVTHYGKRFATTIGTMTIVAPPTLLEWLRQTGMGSLRSSGFGMFDVILQEANG